MVDSNQLFAEDKCFLRKTASKHSTGFILIPESVSSFLDTVKQGVYFEYTMYEIESDKGNLWFYIVVAEVTDDESYIKFVLSHNLTAHKYVKAN